MKRVSVIVNGREFNPRVAPKNVNVAENTINAMIKFDQINFVRPEEAITLLSATFEANPNILASEAVRIVESLTPQRIGRAV